jgi:preprotein translocase subunit SecG
MLFTFVLVVHTLIAIALVAVILMQKSEGGALGIGSGPTGFLSARGAGDVLTRSTAILAGMFIATSIVLAVLAGADGQQRPIDTTLARPATEAPAAPAPAPASDVPLAQ